MKLVALSDAIRRPLPYYLAVEEWVAENLPGGDYLFAWQVDKSVICGRHQLMQLEVDAAFCHENGVEVWRRRSGGGAVYADRNNLMFSYITDRCGNKGCFEFYTQSMCKMLAEIGINANPTGRNDIEIAGRKVAGNAYYGLKNRSIVHGTMLYDADLDMMSHVLTPSRAKLSAKGVKSVPKRITTLREQGINMSIDEFRNYALQTLCDEGTVFLSVEDEQEVRMLMQRYFDEDFRYDKHRGEALPLRIDGCGELRFDCVVDSKNRITEPKLSGDFFANEGLAELLRRLEGIDFDRNALQLALNEIEVNEIITGLDKETLINIILETKPKTL